MTSEKKGTSFSSIPLIDLTNISHPDPKVRAALGRELRDACTRVGFFYIKNHGVPQAVIDAAFKDAERFFELPLEEKKKIDINLSNDWKGYQGLLGENVDPLNRGDLHEAFDIGKEGQSSFSTSTDSDSESAKAEVVGNQWPPEELLPGFRKEVVEYWDHVMSLGRRLFPLFALALDLPEDYFDDKIKNPGSVMRLLHYPPQEGEVDMRQIGIGAHSDYECFTILAQDKVPALQVLNASGEWVDAKPIAGTFVCNLGDQLARWTNDVFVSTIHRAINRSGVKRYSIPFFFGSDYEIIVEPLPNCGPPKYPPIKAGEYVKQRLDETYASTVPATAA